jgi:hypothetical protein
LVSLTGFVKSFLGYETNVPNPNFEFFEIQIYRSWLGVCDKAHGNNP